MENYTCVLCGKQEYGWGNNAEPLASGQCCDICNSTKVIPARIARLSGHRLGSIKTPKKAKSSRENGKKGGRPKKIK